MTTSAAVRIKLQKCVEAENENINLILKNITGGWESWLQVGFAISLLHEYPGIAKREETYPGTTKKSDFMIEPLNGGVNIWVELKTQKNHKDLTIANRFKADKDKINSLPKDFLDNNVVVALAYAVPVDENAVQTLESIVTADSKITVWQLVAKNWQEWKRGGSSMHQSVPTILFFNPSWK